MPNCAPLVSDNGLERRLPRARVRVFQCASVRREVLRFSDTFLSGGIEAKREVCRSSGAHSRSEWPCSSAAVRRPPASSQPPSFSLRFPRFLTPTESKTLAMNMESNIQAQNTCIHYQLNEIISRGKRKQMEDEVMNSGPVEYPTYHEVPRGLSFTCRERGPGYYADPETQCQVWHWCLPSGQKFSFLCPNGTVFSQAVRVCDWWFNVDCPHSPDLYSINNDLYKDKDGNYI